jgi:hypothetical protein
MQLWLLQAQLQPQRLVMLNPAILRQPQQTLLLLTVAAAFFQQLLMPHMPSRQHQQQKQQQVMQQQDQLQLPALLPQASSSPWLLMPRLLRQQMQLVLPCLQKLLCRQEAKGKQQQR